MTDGPLAWTAAAGSHTGRVRRRNEDAAYAGRWLHAVADGLGGHPAGDVASAAVIGTLQAWDTESAAAEPLASLASAIHAASRRLAVSPTVTCTGAPSSDPCATKAPLGADGR